MRVSEFLTALDQLSPKAAALCLENIKALPQIEEAEESHPETQACAPEDEGSPPYPLKSRSRTESWEGSR